MEEKWLLKSFFLNGSDFYLKLLDSYFLFSGWQAAISNAHLILEI